MLIMVFDDDDLKECNINNIGQGLRSYDYAFYLPLTALSWERIGFVSFIVIIGSECEWENDPTLRVILSYLKERKVIISFLPTPLEYRNMLSQTARIFGANMVDFPGLIIQI